jgi:RNA binding exosome subunit
MDFSSVTISFFVQSTEDHERVLSSVSSSFGLPVSELETSEVEGHFGNKILSVRAHVTGKAAQHVATQIFGHLSRASKSQMLAELERSMDEHDSLYLRIDRQTIGNETDLSDKEPIRIKLKPKFRSSREEMKAYYRELMK